MRPDMDKVLVERPRTGGGYLKPKKFRGDPEESPTREKIRPVGRYGSRKQLNENLSPLRKYLESKVGQHWDKVYSELRANVSMDNTVQAHIMQHLWGYVNRDVHVLDGRVFEKTHTFRYELRDGSLYVCPKTKILKKVKQRKAAPKVEVPTFVRIDASHVACLREGIWYKVTLAKLPTEFVERVDPYTQKLIREHVAVTDAFTGHSASLHSPSQLYFNWSRTSEDRRKLYGNASVYATEYKQMNSREIQKLGL